MAEMWDLTTAGIRGRYGEISYAKSWYGFLNAGEPRAAYKGWREQVKEYIMVLGWNPTSLTGTQRDSVLSFARSTTHVNGRIKLIKTNHCPTDVNEVESQIRVLVRDTAKKLQVTNNRLHAERADDAIDPDVCDVQSQCSPPFTLCDSTTSTHGFSGGPIRLGLSGMPKADQDPYYSTNRRNKSRAPPSCPTPGMTKTLAEGLHGES